MWIEYVLNGKRKEVKEAVGRALIKVRAAKQVDEGSYENRSMADKPKIQKQEEATTSILVDSAGVAWNPEIHTAAGIKNLDGTWRKKPGARAASESQE